MYVLGRIYWQFVHYVFFGFWNNTKCLIKLRKLLFLSWISALSYYRTKWPQQIQNKLLKKFFGEETASTKNISNNYVGNSRAESNPRPIREARVRATSAISAGARKNTTKPSLTPTPSSSLALTSLKNNPIELVPICVSSLTAKETDWCKVSRPHQHRSLVTPIPSSLSAADRKTY